MFGRGFLLVGFLPPLPTIIEKSESILLYFAKDTMDFELLNFNINLPVI